MPEVDQEKPRKTRSGPVSVDQEITNDQCHANGKPKPHTRCRDMSTKLHHATRT